MPYIYVNKLTTIGSDNGLSPDWRLAIIWTSAGILLILSFGTKFSEILIEIYTFSFKKLHSKMSSGKLRPFMLCLNVNGIVLLWWLPGLICQNTHSGLTSREGRASTGVFFQSITWWSTWFTSTRTEYQSNYFNGSHKNEIGKSFHEIQKSLLMCRCRLVCDI